jgi:PAS domain S-box-containing protein
MRIRAKILMALLCKALLVVALGIFAINRERAVGLAGVTMGAEDVARTIGYVFAADKDPGHTLTRQIVQSIHGEMGHDIQVIDVHKQIVADAVPGTSLASAHGRPHEVDDALRDGEPRTFIETNPEFPLGSRQMAMPVKDAGGKVLGVVVMEYSPHYDALMDMIRSMTSQMLIAALAAAAIAVGIALYIGSSIVRPLRHLTRAAAAFATGQDYAQLPHRRRDEIGDLTSAFNIMMERRRQAVEALRRAHNQLESRVNERTAELAAANSQLQDEVSVRRIAEEAARRGEERVRQLAAEMSHDRERFEDILNTVPAVVFERWRGDSGRTSFASRHVEKMFGFSSEEWCSAPEFWCERVHPDDRERALKNADDLFAGGDGHAIMRVRWLAKDNRVVWGESHLTTVRNPVDGSLGIRGFTLDITEQKKAEQELKKLHDQLLDASRQAGMAEVATNVLHNVGNVLNSVNISAGLAAGHVHNSSLPHLARVAGLLEQNAGNIAQYMATDPVGIKVPGFLSQLAAQLDTEQKAILEELEQLGKNVEHIKDIVAVQQSYASVAGVTQSVEVVELVEDSLRMNAGALVRHDVQLLREFEASPVICVDKHKVVQILVNLIRNAKYACDESGRSDKRLTVRITGDERVVRVTVIDNGVGIPAENLTRIFSHGFTTRKTGHGFGLHSGALAAKEIGGALLVQSAGPGLGAAFTLEMPLETAKS